MNVEALPSTRHKLPISGAADVARVGLCDKPSFWLQSSLWFSHHNQLVIMKSPAHLSLVPYASRFRIIYTKTSEPRQRQ